MPAGRKEVVGATSCEGHDWVAVPGVPSCGGLHSAQDWPIGPAALVSSKHFTTILLWACVGELLILCTVPAVPGCWSCFPTHHMRIAHLNKTSLGC